MANTAKQIQGKSTAKSYLKNIFLLIAVILAAGVLFTSCAKKNKPIYDVPTDDISSEDFDTIDSDTDSSDSETEDSVTSGSDTAKETDNTDTTKKEETTAGKETEQNATQNTTSNTNQNNNQSNGNQSNGNQNNGNTGSTNNQTTVTTQTPQTKPVTTHSSKPQETQKPEETREPDEPPADFKSTLDYYNSLDYDALMASIQKATMDDIPYIHIEGDLTGISKETKKAVKVTYTSSEQNFECFGMMDIQGATSAGFSKKNYNIRFYSDEERTTKFKVDFNGWGKESKFCLKANYIDATMARNIVSARLWAQVVDTRRNIDPNLLPLVNRGAIDGFPIIVTINNEKPALYTLNIPRDKWMFDMGDGDTEAIMMASYETNSTKFGRLYSLSDANSGWKIEYASGATPNWAVNSLNVPIKVTINSNANFKTDIAKYIDIEAAIDYLLFLWFTTGEDNCCKNTLWVTFDGVKWIPSVYDLDATWGLLWNGQSLMSPDRVMPTIGSDGSYGSKTYSRIWEHIFQTFTEEIIARYSELRATVFTPENVEYEFTRFMAQIPDEAFDLEYDHYPNIPSRYITNLNQILRHHSNVLRYMDATFEKMSQYYLGTSLKVYHD